MTGSEGTRMIDMFKKASAQSHCEYSNTTCDTRPYSYGHVNPHGHINPHSHKQRAVGGCLLPMNPHHCVMCYFHVYIKLEHITQVWLSLWSFLRR